MYDFCILTPTFNRYEFLRKISIQLQAEAIENKVSIVHIIIDDSSDPKLYPYQDNIINWNARRYRIIYKKNPRNYGRNEFWKTWNRLMNAARGLRWRWIITIPDDHYLCNKFFVVIREAYLREKAMDPSIWAMNILVKNLKNWGTDRYVDGAFIAERSFFDSFGWKINPPPNSWWRSEVLPKKEIINPKGSGVGMVMSYKPSIFQNKRIAIVKNVSFLKPMDIPSVMFPPERWPNRSKYWGLSNFIDDQKEEKIRTL